jgi:hypothetical protein
MIASASEATKGVSVRRIGSVRAGCTYCSLNAGIAGGLIMEFDQRDQTESVSG